MRSVNLFVEDSGHELFPNALVLRFAKQYKVTVEIIFYSARGGHGMVMNKLKGYINHFQNDAEKLPDLLIVAIDGNCKGFLGRKQEIDGVTKSLSERVICAIPDPHIERWLLLDSHAFKKVLGKGCSAPSQKCERDLYKRLLAEAVKSAGVKPSLGGIEYSAALVNAMDLERLERTGDSLSKLLKDLRQKFQEWQAADDKDQKKLREEEAPYDASRGVIHCAHLPDNPPA